MHKMRMAMVVVFGVLAAACSEHVSRGSGVGEDAAEQRVSLHAADGHQIGIIVAAAS